MSKEAVFRITLEPELRTVFMAEAAAANKPAAQILRELMREFIQRQQDSRDYDTFLGRKVDAARSSMHAGIGQPNDAVETTFAARRGAVTPRT